MSTQTTRLPPRFVTFDKFFVEVERGKLILRRESSELFFAFPWVSGLKINLGNPEVDSDELRLVVDGSGGWSL